MSRYFPTALAAKAHRAEGQCLLIGLTLDNNNNNNNNNNNKGIQDIKRIKK
jgi:hypothetical protein